MKFNEFPLAYNIFKKDVKKEFRDYMHFYETLLTDVTIQLHSNAKDGLINTHNQWLSERDWITAGKPYYNVYPGIVPYLCRLKEEKVLCDYVSLPMQEISFRFAETENYFNFEWDGKTYGLKSLLAGNHKESLDLKTNKIGGDPSLILWMDFGELDFDRYPVFVYRKVMLPRGMNIDKALDILADDSSISEGVHVPNECIKNALRCVLSCCLISQNRDDGLIEPEVLSADKEKFDRTGDMKYVEKAKRRGKYGWTVGEHLEVNPHYRGPSPLALYWTGKGRQVPLYRFRRGTIVHRKKVAELPTGYQEEENDGITD